MPFLEEKIETIAKEIYGADGVTLRTGSKERVKRITDMGLEIFRSVWQRHSILFRMTRRLLRRPRDLP